MFSDLAVPSGHIVVTANVRKTADVHELEQDLNISRSLHCRRVNLKDLTTYVMNSAAFDSCERVYTPQSMLVRLFRWLRSCPPSPKVAVYRVSRICQVYTQHEVSRARSREGESLHVQHELHAMGQDTTHRAIPSIAGAP